MRFLKASLNYNNTDTHKTTVYNFNSFKGKAFLSGHVS